ncbi:MAG: ATP--guanido phosphotransferase [Planctomycetota bacterium]
MERPPKDPLFPLKGLCLLGEGQEQDVVVSTRMRLARNVQGFRFKTRFREGEAARLVEHMQEALAATDPALRYLALDALTATQREVLFERHLISAEHVADTHPRGVASNADGTTSIMVNEEDHLRVQGFSPGLELDALSTRVEALDDALGCHVKYCFDQRYGFLTSCPTNTGTGLRISVMLHLPALAFRREAPQGGGQLEPGIVKVHKAAQKLGLTVRGTHGESSRAEGDFYQVSNQVTLGRSPEQTGADLRKVLDHVIQYERQSRDILLKDDRTRLEDLVWRAWAILCHARRISSREALAHLSALRLGVWLKILPQVQVGTLHELMMRMGPGHLKLEAGRELAPRDRDVTRAKLIREVIARPAS